ncbi:MAG TPA: hypothetical protein VF749_10520 [Candidatus Acidoferrum sp.]
MPKQIPVTNRREPTLGTTRTIGLPEPNRKRTSDNPTSTSAAVPMNWSSEDLQASLLNA